MKLQVRTTAGIIEGTAVDGVRKFLGFPFATAERFHNSEPLRQEGALVRAEKYGPKCPQLQIPVVPDNGLPQSEDCLYMNVWAPEQCERAPVLFWTYGGAFSSGEGSADTYEGTRLVKKGGVIVVTYNYRLGVFGGFYPLHRYTKEKDIYTPNAGLSDVRCALSFVHENIAAFGGDPDNITIAGESAGAVITAVLAGAKELQGMFSKVILESFLDMEKFGKPGRNPAEELLAAAGVKDAAQLLERGSAEILEAQAKTCGGNPAMSGCGIVTDGTEKGETLWERIGHNMAGKSILLGTNRDEAAVFVPPELAGTPQADEMKAFMTKNVFEIPTMCVADAALENNRVFLYRFDYAPAALRANGMGAFHSAEMDYVFGNLTPVVTGSEEEAGAVSDCMMEAWTEFVRNGTPGWTAYAKDDPRRFHFDAQSAEQSIQS